MEIGYPAPALDALAAHLSNTNALWVVGGSTGLVLRGAALASPPRDLDIYTDEQDVTEIHRRLKAYAIDEPSPSTTPRYRSILSHYLLEGTVIELVADFEVRALGSLYRTEVRRILHPDGESWAVPGTSITLVPLAHELLFNMLREREDRVDVIGRLIREQPERHLKVLRQLIERNEISPETQQMIRSVADPDGQAGKAGMG
jgi:hypothetical protein